MINRGQQRGEAEMNTNQFGRRTLMAACAVLTLVIAPWPTRAGKEDRSQEVTTIRVPNSGIQPQVATDGKGVLHMVYFTGDQAHGDLYYVRSADGGATSSAPIKVNSHPGTAIAAGNIRGAHIAIARNGRGHVARNDTYHLNIQTVPKPSTKKPLPPPPP